MRRASTTLLTTTRAGELLRCVVPGLYQIGGTVDVALWEIGSAPSSQSSALQAGTVHSFYLRRDDVVWVAPSSAATGTTQITVWLAWPDEE